MKLFLHTSEVDRDGKRLQKVVEELTSEEELEVMHTIENLKLRLYNPIGEDAIAVLMACNEEELDDIFSLKNLLRNIRLVLIVPDQKQKTIETAHRLLPRFLGYKSSEFEDLAKVLDKMINPEKE